MIGRVAAAGAAAAVISAAVTACVRRVALRRGLLDRPNSRSSHSVPTPRGGGVGMVAGSSIAIALLEIFGIVRLPLAAVLVGGGGAIALVGFLDDHRPLPPWQRLTVHLAAAIAASAVLGGLPELQWGSTTIQFGLWGHVLCVLGMVWVLNLFNFMDGIDGIAATEAVFITSVGAMLVLVVHADSGIAASSLVIASAAIGFLVWNWPPAKIFMGDVGSGYLGFVVACLAIASAHEHFESLFAWLILGGVFFVDATLTLFARMLRGEKIFLPHRSHAYQRLSRKWGSHLKVTLLVLAVNLFWLLPLAFFAQLCPRLAIYVLALALCPLSILVFAVSYHSVD